jgi:hypothetical protein
MSLIDQALTTMAEARRYLSLYTYTAVTSTETLTADTAAVTFGFAHTDIALNSLGTVKQITSAGVTATLTASQYTVDYVGGTLTFSSAMTGSITVSDYDYFAWDYSKDNHIERLINSVSSMVAKYCNRKFIADTYSEFYKGSGRQKLVLNQYPINAITSVKVDSAALTAGTDYVTSDATYNDQGIIFKPNGWTWYGYLTGLVGELTAPVDNIEVVYSAGYTLEPEASRDLPWDLEQAVVSMVADLYETQQDGTVGLKRLTQGKLTYEWADNPLIQQYASVLDAYKKRCF